MSPGLVRPGAPGGENGRVDLNLLRVFVAVYETRSLTLAAERLYVTQPAVSQALARMRAEFDDPLFSRAGRVMRPSGLAEALYPEFRDAMIRIDVAVDGVKGFEPSGSQRRFRIALSELGEIGFLPPITAALDRSAPQVGLDVLFLDIARLPEWLAAGTVDVAVTSSPVPGAFRRTRIKSQAYAVLMAEDHPLAQAPLTFDQFLAADHVAVVGDSGRPNFDAALAAKGARVTPRIVLNHFAAVPPVLVGSTLIATVPDSLGATWVGTWPLRMVPLPIAVDPIDVNLYLRATSNRPSALSWFHDLVLSAVRDLPEDLFTPGTRPGAGR